MGKNKKGAGSQDPPPLSLSVFPDVTRHTCNKMTMYQCLNVLIVIHLCFQTVVIQEHHLE